MVDETGRIARPINLKKLLEAKVLQSHPFLNSNYLASEGFDVERDMAIVFPLYIHGEMVERVLIKTEMKPNSWRYYALTYKNGRPDTDHQGIAVFSGTDFNDLDKFLRDYVRTATFDYENKID